MAIAFLHFVQPAARLTGRLSNGLTIWRRRGAKPREWALRKKQQIWSETWYAPEKWLGDLESSIKDQGAAYVRGGDFDHWDLAVFAGLFGAVRVRMAIEEHGAGKQLIRFHAHPYLSLFKILITTVSVIITGIALFSQAWIPATSLTAWTLLLLLKQRRDTLSAMTSLIEAMETVKKILAQSPPEKVENPKHSSQVV